MWLICETHMVNMLTTRGDYQMWLTCEPQVVNW